MTFLEIFVKTVAYSVVYGIIVFLLSYISGDAISLEQTAAYIVFMIILILPTVLLYSFLHKIIKNPVWLYIILLILYIVMWGLVFRFFGDDIDKLLGIVQ